MFNVLKTPQLFDPSVSAKNFFKAAHLAGQWFIYALIMLHLAGVFFHVVVARDRILDRMLPTPRRATDNSCDLG